MQYEDPLPLITKVPLPPSPSQIMHVVHNQPYVSFLDSGLRSENLGRYSFIATDPFMIMKSRGAHIIIQSGTEEEHIYDNPFDVLDNLLKKYEKPDWNALPLPFPCGAIGYLGYDLCHFIETLPSTAIDDLLLPDSCFVFYDVAVAFDHLSNSTYIVSTGFPEVDVSKRLKRASERTEEMQALLSAASTTFPIDGLSLENDGMLGTNTYPPIPKSNFSPQEYMEAVERVREYIAAGDVFQVNLSQRFEVDCPPDAYKLYKHLQNNAPAPFGAYLQLGDVTILSNSPERFLKVEGNSVETRPMKGTRPRKSSPIEDAAQANELVNSTKDKAENIMIVDLERNDLGRVCRYGTVRVRELLSLEKYATVFQLTSTIEGTLLPHKRRIDLLKACFPGGSITGAPKVRAMEIIDELEPNKRSVYTGAIGYFGFGGQMDFNIAIRTILMTKGKAYFQVGGGIIYDSDPEKEYQETLDKAQAIFNALRLSPTPSTAL
ncbi:MAG: aminodeoxychorismate synthase component I [Chloroflexota bacterium]|nr:aminodeoxychorismate synthase component I [Chloroflexota bacterium]